MFDNCESSVNIIRKWLAFLSNAHYSAHVTAQSSIFCHQYFKVTIFFNTKHDIMTTTYRLFVFYSRGKCMQILFLEIIKIIFPYFIHSHELIYEYLQKTICRFRASELTTPPPPPKLYQLKFFLLISFYMHVSWKMRF